MAGNFVKANNLYLSIPSDKYTILGLIWGRDYTNINSVAYAFAASVGAKRVFLYKLGAEGNASITAEISGRDITFATKSIDEFYYFHF